MASLELFDHPAWKLSAGTLVGYGLALTVFFLVLFVLPFALFALV